MASEMNYHLDLVADYREFLLLELESYGFKPGRDADFETVCVRYYNLKRRLIHPRKRRIHKSAEFGPPAAGVRPGPAEAA